MWHILKRNFTLLRKSINLIGNGIDYLINDIDWQGIGESIGRFIVNIANGVTTWWDNILLSRPGRKGHLEDLENKKQNPNWIPSKKFRRPKKPKKHTPGRDHRKYIYLLIEILKKLLGNDENEWEYMDRY